MLLQALREYSTRLDDLGPPMYERRPVRYEIQLDSSGNLLGLITLSSGEGRRTDPGLSLFVPSDIRTMKISPRLLADRGDYALGWGNEPKTADRHASFVELVRDCAVTTGDHDVEAVAQYLDKPREELIGLPEGVNPKSVFVIFSVDGRRPVDSPVVREYWATRVRRARLRSGDKLPPCLVCGERLPVLSRIPYKVKGLDNVGGDKSGSVLISANKDVFESYHLEHSLIAPTCSECAERVSKALNALIDDEATRLYLGRVLYVFWTREPADDLAWASLLSRADPGQVEALLTAALRGRTGATTLDTTAFYCVAISGSGGRVAVRDWIDITVAEARQNLARYFALQRLIDARAGEQRYFGIRTLADATVREGSKDDPSPDVPQSLMRVALRGGALPVSLIAQVIRRVRAGQSVSYPQAALIKMVLASQLTEGWEMYMVGLDERNRDPAYLCGRLLAVLDAIQRAALGERNATIIDRFFGSASTAPLSVFGRLTRGAQPHLARLRRDRPGVYIALDRKLQEIISAIDAFPRTLTLREQGMFVLGYYHQKAADATERNQRAAARRAVDTALSQPSESLSENDENEG